VAEWQFADTVPAEKLAMVHFFSVVQKAGDREVEFLITVKEYAEPADLMMKFFATTEKQTNQKTTPFRPCGWGRTLLQALSDCTRAIRKFPYEGE